VELPDGSSVPVLSAERLAELIVQAARCAGLVTPAHPDRPEGWLIRWGTQVLAKVVHRSLDGGELTEGHVSAYLAKYSTKGSEAAGLVATRITQGTIGAYADHNTHVGKLIEACWRLGRMEPGRPLLDQDNRPYKGLRRWAHMFGYGGHFSSKSRRYAYNLSKPRRERIRVARAIAQGLDPTQLADTDDQTTTVVIGQWRYVGTGWLTTGDAALAAMAADAARRRRPAGLTSAEAA
jgi:hypothetical protein